MDRHSRLYAIMDQHNLDSLLISSNANTRYLCEFATEERDVATLFFSREANYLITDYRFEEQAQEESQGLTVVSRERAVESEGQLIARLAKRHGLTRLGFEEDYMGYGRWQRIQADLSQLQCTPVSGLVEKMRQTKDETELECLRLAARIAVQSLDTLLGRLSVGMTEIEAANILEASLKDNGSEGLAFPTILTSGPRTSMPHGKPGQRIICAGDWMMVDFGAVVNGYRSDMTRTVVVGKADNKQQELYQLVREAQQLGIDRVTAGTSFSEPSLAVSTMLSKTKYADFASAGLGHCVGLELHERPYLENTATDILEENMVVTVEPGIYIPNYGGVRIEDDLRVTKAAPEVLTDFPRTLIEL